MYIRQKIYNFEQEDTQGRPEKSKPGYRCNNANNAVSIQPISIILVHIHYKKLSTGGYIVRPP